MQEELDKTFSLVRSGKIRNYPVYGKLSDELLELRHVALSGDGEPTLCPSFADAVERVVQVRALHPRSFFKLALMTDGARLDSRLVQKSLQHFIGDDEIWVKLDIGTWCSMNQLSQRKAVLERILANALRIGRQRPIIIQSLFALGNGPEAPLPEVDEYILRLNCLKTSGAQIAVVKVSSAPRCVARPNCEATPLKLLSRIRQRIKAETGLNAEVF
ncbi:MAG: hypothetical protein ACLQVW_28225 [Limisphaerales bacterium]